MTFYVSVAMSFFKVFINLPDLVRWLQSLLGFFTLSHRVPQDNKLNLPLLWFWEEP